MKFSSLVFALAFTLTMWGGTVVYADDEEITCNDDCAHTLANFEDVLCVNLVCTPDSPAEITATLTINGEEFIRTKECDKVPPVCTASFPRPFEWHRRENFPLECFLTGYSDQLPDAKKAIFEYTGEDELLTVPDGVTEFRIKIWAGGEGGANGETGAYAKGTVTVTQQQYWVVVGAGGDFEGNDKRGGHSGIFTRTTDRGDALLLAKGGGQFPDSICDDAVAGCETFESDEDVPPSSDNPDYRDGVGVGGDREEQGGPGLIVVEWADAGEELNNDDGDRVDINPADVSTTCDTVAVGNDDIFARTICEYTGNNQTVTVPAGVHNARLKVWGAGGGGTPDNDALGGAGGFAEMMVAVDAGEQYAVIVGQGGREDAFGAETYGFGAGGGLGDVSGASGGGLSGVFMDNQISKLNALVIAGGGGGAAGSASELSSGGAGGGREGFPGRSVDDINFIAGHGGRGGTQAEAGDGGDITGDDWDGFDGEGMEGGQGGNAFDDIPGNEYGGGGGGWGGFWGGGGGNGDTRDGDPQWTNGAGGGGGSGFCHDVLDPGCELMSGIDGDAANDLDPDYIPGVGNGGQRGRNGGHGLVVIEWLRTGQCLLDPANFEVIDELEPIHGDVCAYEVCDNSGNCATCESPGLLFDDTPICTGGAGILVKRPDGTCGGTCDPDDDDCLCILGDASKCREGGPINCYTNPFHDRCPGFQNPACLIDPFTPGCPVVNPCYPTRIYDGLNCPRDAIRFCARNPYHYGCNQACKTGDILCSPNAPLVE